MPSSLPIQNIHAEFLTLLDSHRADHPQHIVVEANTGSGKSTQLPIWVADHLPTAKVLVVEPRRLACVALASYISTLVNSALGQRVGYAIRFDQQYQSDTQIQFVTPGIALRWLADNGLSDYDTIIIDEFHERRWDTDLLLALIRHQHQRIILTSATIRGQQLADYLGGARLQSPGKLFPVSIQYTAEQPQQMPSTQHVEQRVKQACEQIIAQPTHRNGPNDILVFLPGRKEIQRCFQQLQGLPAEIICLSASSSKAEQQRALNRQPGLRIILSTNVAETSLTIPHIGYVIDSGLERRTHQRNGRTVLGLDPISTASADQRKGRAGRLSDGHCIRLWGEHAPLRDTTPPEILREELTELVLAAACNDAPITTLTFPEVLPERSIEVATQRLLSMKAIDAQGIATAHGKRLYPLPIDSLHSHLITAMPDADSQSLMIDLVAALNTSQRLITLPDSERERQALTQWCPLECDAYTLVHCMRQSAPEGVTVNHSAIKDAKTLSRQIHQSLGLNASASQQTPPHRLDRKAFILAIARAAPALVFLRRKKRRNAMGNGFTEIVVGDNSRFTDTMEAAIVFDQTNLPGKSIKDTINIGTCLAPLSLTDMIDAGITTQTLGHIHWQDPHLTVDTDEVYAGRVIGHTQSAPSGQQAREAISELICQQRLFAPLGSQLAAALQDLSLYQQLNVPRDDQQPIPALSQWLVDRLTQLGVDSGDDIALIDANDFVVEGIPEWEKQTFAETFPQHITLCDLSLSVEYDVSTKRIVVERISGTRKGEPKRWELPGWSGWRIRYKKASRVVDIR